MSAALKVFGALAITLFIVGNLGLWAAYVFDWARRWEDGFGDTALAGVVMGGATVIGAAWAWAL